MIDRNLEQQIKKIKSIAVLWMQFRDFYRQASGRTNILPEEERAFLDLKSDIARQYQSLLDSSGMSHSTDDRTFEVIASVLSLASVSGLTEMQSKKIESDWHNSYLNFNKILGSLENKKEQLGKINTTEIAIRKFFSSYLVSLISIALFIILAYIILVQILHVDEIIKENLKFIKLPSIEPTTASPKGR